MKYLWKINEYFKKNNSKSEFNDQQIKINKN